MNEQGSVGLITSTSLPDSITRFVAIDKTGYAENVIKDNDEYECWDYYYDSYVEYDTEMAILFVYNENQLG